MNEVEELKKSMYDTLDSVYEQGDTDIWLVTLKNKQNERLDKVYERGNTNVWQNLLYTIVDQIPNDIFEIDDDDEDGITNIKNAIYETARISIKNHEISNKHNDIILKRLQDNLSKYLYYNKTLDFWMFKTIRRFVEYVLYKKVGFDTAAAVI